MIPMFYSKGGHEQAEEVSQFDAVRTHLYLKEEPLVKRMALVLGCGWSKRRKNEWYSTQIFQKILHWSRLPIRNSSVS